ncbi:Uncharacterised protein [Mycobacteroides abscessus subsp. abscessus]|nr:Uncharacterised protein [Mycobacteroides abscessus subsp. abscessus]
MTTKLAERKDPATCAHNAGVESLHRRKISCHCCGPTAKICIAAAAPHSMNTTEAAMMLNSHAWRHTPIWPGPSPAGWTAHQINAYTNSTVRAALAPRYETKMDCTRPRSQRGIAFHPDPPACGA